MKNHDKVPSVITYSKQSEKREQQWGSSISPDAITMVHTKLELDVHDVDEELDFIQQSLEGMNSLNINYIKSKGSLPVYTFKSPEVIVEDYLSKVFQYLEKDVDQFTEELREEIPTDIVATIPTVSHNLRCLISFGAYCSLGVVRQGNKFHISSPYQGRFQQAKIP